MAVTRMTKREFLQTIGSLPPTLRLLLGVPPAALASAATSEKFTPVDASRFLTLPIEKLKTFMKEPVEPAKDLSGRQSFRGIPFDLPGYAVLSTRAADGVTSRLQVPVHGEATFICLAQFCDPDENETPPPKVDRIEKVGQTLADLVLVFEDGTEHRHPIRRRFEVGPKSVVWGHLCFAAVPHREDVPSALSDALSNARDWGDLQIGVWDSNYAGQIVWLSAVANPYPDRALTALRFESRHENPLGLCGVTLFHGRENPLRYERLSLYRLTLPEPSELKRWDVAVDLGVIARQYQLPVVDAEPWLASPRVGLGDSPELGEGARFVYFEISASREAALMLRDRQTNRQYEFDLGQATQGREVAARNSGAQIEFLERDKVWLH